MTMTLISTITVGSGGASSIDFNSIPGTYTDLQVLVSARFGNSQVATVTWIQFNGSTSNQSSRMLNGNGSGASSYTDTKIFGQSNGANATANTFGNTSFYIPNYAGSTNKAMSIDGVAENNASNAFQELVAGLWSNTSAITSITLKEYNGTGTFAQDSTASLYGITKGSGGATVS
jgi:hypothetical protein